MRLYFGLAKPTISVVCVSMRRSMLNNVIENFTRQRHPTSELILILHGVDELSKAERELLAMIGARYQCEDKSRSLGELLNSGFDSARGAAVVKWDDDDFYGSYFLDEVDYFCGRKSDVVGKGSWLAYIESLDQLFLRFPEGAFRDGSTLAGGTITAKRSRISSLRFPNQNLGEDQGFLQNARQIGIVPYSTSASNYVQIRRSCKDEHAWGISDAEYLTKSVFLANGRDFALCDRGDFGQDGSPDYRRWFSAALAAG